MLRAQQASQPHDGSALSKKAVGFNIRRLVMNPINDPSITPPSKPATPEGAATGELGHETAPAEIGGRGGLDPTRYGDWEKNGRCIDF